MTKRAYRIVVTITEDNPNTGMTTLSGEVASEQSADVEELKRRLRGTFASQPKISIDEIGPQEMSTDPAVYRTKTGRVLTDDEIEALADEAERGYAVPRARRSK